MDKKQVELKDEKESIGIPDTRPESSQPFGTPIDKLEVSNKQPGWHYVWMSSIRAQSAVQPEHGYQHVTHGDKERIVSPDVTGTSGGTDSRVTKIVSRNGDINYLMKIPQEWYEKDEYRRQARTREIDSQLKSAEISPFPGMLKKPNYGVTEELTRTSPK